MALDIQDVTVTIEGNADGPSAEHRLSYRVEIPGVAFEGAATDHLLGEIDKAVTARVNAAIQDLAQFHDKPGSSMQCHIEHDDIRDVATKIASVEKEDRIPTMEGARHVVTGRARIFSLGNEPFGLNEAISRAGGEICWQVGRVVAGCTRKMALQGQLPLGESKGQG